MRPGQRTPNQRTDTFRALSSSRYDRDFWEALWSRTLREHATDVARRPPSTHLIAAAEGLAPRLALDAGCGHGSETLWLAAHGWHVTAVAFSAAALAQARSSAQAAGADVAGRIDFVEADLGSWVPQQRRYDLVTCLYVHVAGPVEEMVRRLGSGFATGGLLLLAGHRPVDPETGAATAAAGQVQVSIETATAALDRRRWEILVAEDRPRAAAGTGVDAVIHARRR